MVVAFLLPALVLFTAVLAPMEVGGPGVVSYARVLAFASSWWGAGLLMLVIALPLFHAAHRIYHGLHDLHIHGPDRLMLVLCYGGATALSGCAALALLQLL